MTLNGTATAATRVFLTRDEMQPFLPVCRPALRRWRNWPPTWPRPMRRGTIPTGGGWCQRLEARLAGVLGLPDHALRTPRPGTSAIEIAILAAAGPAKAERPLALTLLHPLLRPALAAERAGIGPSSAMSTRDLGDGFRRRRRAPRPGPDRLFLPVACFGRLPDLAGVQRRFLRRPAFPSSMTRRRVSRRRWTIRGMCRRPWPVTLSFHATKTYSTAEGGAVLWDDPAGAEALTRAANFGFNFPAGRNVRARMRN